MTLSQCGAGKLDHVQKLLGLSYDDRKTMLRDLGLSDAEALFDCIPDTIRRRDLDVGQEHSEHELKQLVHRLTVNDVSTLDCDSYLGHGCYEHEVPSVIDAVVSRGEFLTAYTPYQPEMSQGILAAIEEFQEQIKAFTNMQVVTCGHYDGNTALAEAALMAATKTKKKVILVDRSIYSLSRKILANYCFAKDINLVDVDITKAEDELSTELLERAAALLVHMPSTEGHEKKVSQLLSMCNQTGVVRIVSINPSYLPVFNFDLSTYADIVTMEGQSLGIHMHAGGAHLGIIACTNELRHLTPGRLVGSVTDIHGKRALALVFEDREQHVARERATSNICSNQALNAIRVGIFLKLTGKSGLTKRLHKSIRLANAFLAGLSLIPEITAPKSTNFFEFLISLPDENSLQNFVGAAKNDRVFCGVTRSVDTSLSPEQLKISITETKNIDHLERYIKCLASVLEADPAPAQKACRDSFEKWSHSKEDEGRFDAENSGSTEVSIVREYTAHTRKNFGVDTGSYPLGSCTMKYNPKRNDQIAELDKFRWTHPLQPSETISGLIKIYDQLKRDLCGLLGMDSVDLTPAAGAHGELKGLLIAKRFFADINEQHRNEVIIPESAHGTNPATAAMVGYQTITVKNDRDGNIDINEFRKAVSKNTAVIMITNPSTLGVFEKNIEEIITLTHEFGALAYYDGANMNALMGKTSPGHMGFDIAHINVHKTLSTPHGGGGPGAGPVGVREFLNKYVSPGFAQTGIEYNHTSIKSYAGHISVLLRAYCYIRSMGSQGLEQATEDAVLNANYLMKKLSSWLPPAFNRPCMHEFVIDGSQMSVDAVSLSKRLIDYNIHPPTLVGAGCVYYGDGLQKAMLFEPTESESKSELDFLVNTIEKIFNEAKLSDDFLDLAPYTTEIRRIASK